MTKNKSWLNSKTHKRILQLITSQSISYYAGSLSYGVVTVMVAYYYNALTAGIFLSGFNFLQAYIINPISGTLTDRIGSKKTIYLGLILMMAASIVWLSLPMSNPIALCIFGFLYLGNFSFRQMDEVYILRLSGKKEGGFNFGLAESIHCLARFIATLSIPYFILTNHQTMAAWVMLGSALISFVGMAGLPEDKIRKRENQTILNSINPLLSIKQGWNFVKKNDGYPLMVIGNSLFEGVFYGSIWFVFPLHLIKFNTNDTISGLTLGIYEVVFFLTATYFGSLADKKNWRVSHILGWILMAIGVIVLPLNSFPMWLIMIGIIIAVGNSMSNFAADHALEEYDVDHREDGSFIALKNIVNDTGYALAPLAAGFLFYKWGFEASLSFTIILTIIIAAWMTWLTKKTKSND